MTENSLGPRSLNGRHVAVTGGGGALGGAVTAALVRQGAIVHLPVRGARPPAAFAAEPNVHVTTGVDLTSDAAVTSFYAGLPSALWASIHVAGGFAMGGIAETALVDLRAQIDVNAVTAFLCCREAIRRFRARPGGGGGRIVNVASRAGLRPAAMMAAYSMAKAAVVALTESLAAEVAGEDIRVNAVAPGTMDTPANRAAIPDLAIAGAIDTADVAALIVWLASPDNAVVSGAIVPAYGST